VDDLVQLSYNHTPTTGCDKQILEKCWTRILSHLNRDNTELESQELHDYCAKKLWPSITFKDKVKMLLIGVGLPAALVMIAAIVLFAPPISLGAPVLIQLSLSELAILGGAGVLTGLSAGSTARKGIEDLILRHSNKLIDELGDVACDTFGLPRTRQARGNKQREIPPPQLQPIVEIIQPRLIGDLIPVVLSENS
jgi:hypothetical protein